MATVGGIAFDPTRNVGGALNKIGITVMEPERSDLKMVRGAVPKVMRLPTPTSPESDSYSPLERPGSALLRGVQITEYKDVRVNPEPESLEESDVILDDYLSPKKLRDLSGTEDLEEVQFLELKVDTRETSLGNFGAHVPNLSQLKLSNSIIFSIRDLGSCLTSLRVLWMSRCGLEDLDGVSAMQSLQELYLAYNEIHDISPCSLLESVKILDLEGNNIEDIHQVQFLELCGNLTQLTLEGNPVCMMPAPDASVSDYNYRAEVKKFLPQVTLLDDEPLNDVSVTARPTSAAFEEDWKLIAEFLNDGSVIGEEESVAEFSGRPGTSVRPTTGYRPGSALKQQVNSPLRPASRASKSPLNTGSSRGSVRPMSGRPASTGRPGSAGRPTTAMRSGSAEEMEEWTDSSDLTRGKVVCGNPSKALRSRARQSHLTEDVSSDASSLLANYRSQEISRSEVTSKKTDPHLKELFSEIDEWRKDNEKRKSHIAQEKEPQILTINHEDSLSDGEGSSSDETDGKDEILYSTYNQRGFGDVDLSTQSGPKKSPERLPKHKATKLLPSDEYRDLPEDQLMRESSASSSSSFGSVNTPPDLGRNSSYKGKIRSSPSARREQSKMAASKQPVVRSSSLSTGSASPEVRSPDVKSPHVRSPNSRSPDARTGPTSVTSPPNLNPRRKLPNVSLLPSKTLPKS